MPSSNLPASTQFGAVASLRWRLFVNGFRRKEGAGEFVAKAIVYPVGLLFLIGPVAGAGFSSYAALANGRPGLIAIVFWAIFVLQMLVSVNLSPAAQSFAPESLIRFPLTLTRYVTIRLFLGLLSPSTVTGTCALLAGALGASLAAPGLAPVLFSAALSLALADMLFVRMIFVWIDRWLSTRRSRELLTGLIVCIGIAAQYLNVTFNDIGHHSSRAAQAAKMAAAAHLYQHFEPVFAHLPPGLAGAAVLNQSRAHTSFAMAEIAGILLYAALFLAVFTSRMMREYRGEDLSEGIAQPKAALQTHAPVPDLANATAESRFGLSPLIAGCLRKELLYLRRNVSQFYGFLAPLAMVFLFAGRLGSFGRTGMLFPAAVAYSFLGIAALAYNVLGIDASGIQAYLLAPVRMRDVILAKNLLGFALSGVQLVLVYLLVFFTAGPPPLLLTLATVLWIVAATFFNAAVGNIRSITTPKKVDPNKVQRRQASQLSALMSLGLMLLAGAVGASLILLSRALQLPWLPIPVLLACAIVAVLFYWGVLSRIDSLIYAHRETLLDELTKAS